MSRASQGPEVAAGGGRALRLLAPFLLLAAGCGEQDTDPGPGGVTVGEARELDDAAEMLEQQRLEPVTADEEAPPAK